MKTEQELKDALEDIFFDALTDKSNPPYYTDKVDPENDGRWQYKVYELCADELIKRGYGDVSEYKAEIERLKAEFKQLETNAEILARGVRDLNHENYELTEKIKQAQIDVLNRVMTYINDKIENDYGDMSDSVNYITIDIDDFDDFIDELIKEVQNGKDKS